MADGDAAVVAAPREVVEISGGSVVVEEWAWAKVPEMVKLLGRWDLSRVLCEHSVRPDDRPKIASLSNKDLAKVTAAVYRVNVDEDFLKNLTALAGTIEKLGEGLVESTG